MPHANRMSYRVPYTAESSFTNVLHIEASIGVGASIVNEIARTYLFTFFP